MVKRPTEMPDAILERVRVFGAAVVFLPVSFQCRLSYGVRVIIIMYGYHVLINALSAHMILINLNMIFYTHVEHSLIKTFYIKYYTNKQNTKQNKKALHTHTHTHTSHTHTHNDCSRTGY